MSTYKKLFKKAGGKDILKQYLHTGMWWRGPLQLMATGISIKGLEIFRHTANLRIYLYIKKRYWKELDRINSNKFEGKHEKSNKVWVCWFQGMEQAPLLVRHCYEQMKRNLKNEEIVLITNENMDKYVQFPNYIIQKYHSGAITRTHLTDLLRLELLTRYGGTWIDATVLCTGELPDYVTCSDLFFFRTLKPGLDGHAIGLSSWFMSAKSNNRLLIAVRELMYSYWRDNDHLIEYFLIHIFLQMAMEKYPEEIAAMPKHCNSTPHILQLQLFELYDDRLFHDICAQTFIHKLSYKFNQEKTGKAGTYFDMIINKNKSEKLYDNEH